MFKKSTDKNVFFSEFLTNCSLALSVFGKCLPKKLVYRVQTCVATVFELELYQYLSDFCQQSTGTTDIESSK